MIQRNAVKALDIEETFEFEIPEEVRIFDDITRQKILDVAKENTSYRAGTPPKYDFLLRRVLIDPDGHAIEAMPKGKR